MKKNPFFDEEDDEGIKNTKNTVKNIVKMFSNWLQFKCSENNSEIRVQLGKFLVSDKYNNKLILKIAKSPSISKAFMEFL